jgi:hypothetical protein
MTVMSDRYRGTPEYTRARNLMIFIARQGTVVEYFPQIAEILGIAPHDSGDHIPQQIGQLCGEISEDEFLAGRPLLSAVAMNRNGLPGPGFFKLATALRQFHGGGNDAETEYWLAEHARVCDYWQEHT